MLVCAAVLAGVGALVLYVSQRYDGQASLPEAAYEEQADGAKRVIVDELRLADFCRDIGLPEPPGFSGLDGVLTQGLYDAHAAIARTPGLASPYGRLGDLYQAHDYPERAILCYKKANEIEESYEWHYQISRVHATENRPDMASASLRETLKCNPTYAPAHFHLGEGLRELGETDAAEAAYREYVRRRPDDAAGYVGLALVQRMRQNDEQALALLGKALEKNPNDYRAHFQLAQIYQRLGDTAAYEKHIGRYHSLPRRTKISDPLASRIRWLGVTPLKTEAVVQDLHLQQRYPEALQFCLKAIRKRPRHPGVLRVLATCFHRVGDHEQALRAVERSLELEPRSFQSFCTLCEVCLGSNRYTEVIEAADKAIQMDATREYPYWLKAQALRRSGRLSDSIESYKQAAERAPDHFLICLSYAGALHEAGRLPEARDAYQQALRAKPGDENAQIRLRDVENRLEQRTTSQPASSRPA